MTAPFAIGITGHRPHKLTAQALPVLRATLRRVLEGAAARLSPRPMACVSSLAEGADTMAADAALALHWKLIAPLPFPADDYAQDFAAGPPRDAFWLLLGQAEVSVCTAGRATLSDVAKGYRAASHAMLDRSDAVIAVWNGVATALIGGAYDTMLEAVRRGLPVLWLPSAGDAPPRFLTAAALPALQAGTSAPDAGGEDDFIAALA